MMVPSTTTCTLFSIILATVSAQMSCPSTIVPQRGLRCGVPGQSTTVTQAQIVDLAGQIQSLDNCAARCYQTPACKALSYDPNADEGLCSLYNVGGGTNGIQWKKSKKSSAEFYNARCFVRPDPCFIIQISTDGDADLNDRYLYLLDDGSQEATSQFSMVPSDATHFTIDTSSLTALDVGNPPTGPTVVTLDDPTVLSRVDLLTAQDAEAQDVTVPACSMDATTSLISCSDNSGNALQSYYCEYQGADSLYYLEWFMGPPGADTSSCTVQSGMMDLVAIAV